MAVEARERSLGTAFLRSLWQSVDSPEERAGDAFAVEHVGQVLVGTPQALCRFAITPSLLFKFDLEIFACEHETELTKARLHVHNKMKPDLHFSKKLQSLLEKRGLKPAGFAREIGISHVAVGNWLKGAVPKSDKLRAIAEFFDVPIGDLLFEAHLDRIQEASRKAVAKYGETPEAQAAMEDELKTLDAEEKRVAKTFRERAAKLIEIANKLDPPKRSESQR
jgi:transcriptional regulator with XRE-family HTH domain